MRLASIFAFLFVILGASALGCGTPFTGGAGGTGGAPGTTSTGAPCVPADDNNPCTEDVCENGVPVNKPAAAGTLCATGGSRCDGLGSCVDCLAPTDCAGMD